MNRKARPTVVTNVSRAGRAHHFFGSSLGTWLVRDDITKLISALQREGLPFNIWYVPGPVTDDYQIANYAPQVEGAVWLGFYGYDKKS